MFFSPIWITVSMTIYGLVFVGSILIVGTAFHLYQHSQHPPFRARIGLISMSLLLVLSVAGMLVLIFYAHIGVRSVLPLFLLPYAVCVLIGPINVWTSINESYRNSSFSRIGTLLTGVGIAIVVVVAVTTSMLMLLKR